MSTESEIIKVKVSNFFGVDVLKDEDGNIYRIKDGGHFDVVKDSIGEEIIFRP